MCLPFHLFTRSFRLLSICLFNNCFLSRVLFRKEKKRKEKSLQGSLALWHSFLLNLCHATTSAHDIHLLHLHSSTFCAMFAYFYYLCFELYLNATGVLYLKGKPENRIYLLYYILYLLSIGSITQNNSIYVNYLFLESTSCIFELFLANF